MPGEHVQCRDPRVGHDHLGALRAQQRRERIDRAHVVVGEQDLGSVQAHVDQRAGGVLAACGQPTPQPAREQPHLVEQTVGSGPVLEHDRLGVGLEPLRLGFAQRPAGVHDHRRRLGALLLERLQKFEAVHVGQGQVENHAVEALLHQRLQRLARAARAADEEVLAAEAGHQRVRQGGVVLDDQQTTRRGGDLRHE
jgi:hypothetical protein